MQVLCYDISKLKEKLSIYHDERIDNEKAAICLRKAKQSIDMEICKELYYQSVLSRNLFIAHLIVSFLILIFVSFSFKILFFLFGLCEEYFCRISKKLRINSFLII